MQIGKGKPPRSGQLTRVGVELSRTGRMRLAWMDFYRVTQNVALTWRHFGISRQTFYRWQGRYDVFDLTTLGFDDSGGAQSLSSSATPADLVFSLEGKGPDPLGDFRSAHWC
jgi:hypothetical protein